MFVRLSVKLRSSRDCTMMEKELVERFGSPLFVLDKEALISKYRMIHNAFDRRYPTTVAYSVKTNYLPYICKTLYDAGSDLEIIPGFEFGIVSKLKADSNRIIVNGPYKSEEFLVEIVKKRYRVNVDNFQELRLLDKISKRLNKKIKIGIRVNGKISDLRWNRFGFNLDSGEALKAIDFIKSSKNLSLNGLSIHIGTNITDASLYQVALEKVLILYNKIKADENIDYIDLGGGFVPPGSVPITENFKTWHIPQIADYAKPITKMLNAEFKGNPRPTLIIEPGRFIVDEAMHLLTKVTAIKDIYNRKAVVVDAGINIVPSSLYRKRLINSLEKRGGKMVSIDVYGPLCMQTDKVASDILLPDPKVGDLLKIDTCGAYELSESMQFIQARPAVISIDKNKVIQIRRKEDFMDVTAADDWSLLDKGVIK